MARNPFIASPEKRRTAPEDLSHDEAKAEVGDLRDALEQFNKAYYVDADPMVADAVWDRLFSRLQKIEERFDDLRSDSSPTARVGAAPVDSLDKVPHSDPMLSLHAVHEQEEAARLFSTLEEFAPGSDDAKDHAKGNAESGATRDRGSTPLVVAEPKFDGLSLEVAYSAGRMARAVTRGDGRTGDDVTANARTIRSLPLRLSGNVPGELAVRGEVVLRRREFAQLNRSRVERGDEPFANPRNAAAGSMRLLDSRAVARVPLDIIFYDILASDDNRSVSGEPPRTHGDELELLSSLGLPVSDLNKPVATIDELADYRQQLLDQLDDLPMELDGIVAKLNDLEARERAGVRDRSPRWAFAWKFPPRRERTRVREITVSVGRTGKLTPVVLLDPVDIGGVTVSRASLHNAHEVSRLDVRTGDMVRLERAGDVIPQVVERIPERGRKRADPFTMPGACPSCGTQVVREGAYHRCPNGLACRAQLAGALEHYGSRGALDIDQLGEKTARLLVDEGLVEDLADLYEVDRDRLAECEGFGAKSADRLVDSIASTGSPELGRFIYALGIPGVGAHLARTLARAFGSIDALRGARRSELKAVEEIGGETAQSIQDFFQSPDTSLALDRLLEHVEPHAAASRDSHLAGTTIVLTGQLENFTREEAKTAIEQRGGRATSSVSGETDYLVAGSGPGSKLDEARDRGVAVIDEEEFQALLAGKEMDNQ